MPGRDTAARLERHWRQPRAGHTDFEDLIGFPERALDVATWDAPGEGNVRPELGVREGRVLFERLLRIDHRLERVGVDIDKLEGVPRNRSRLSDDDRNRVADKVGAHTGQ